MRRERRGEKLGLLIVALTLLPPGCRPSTKEEAQPSSSIRRVVLVSIDTLHVRFTSPYNPDVTTTPTLGKLAEEGVRFERAYTHAPVTLPSHAALMTGRSPIDLGVLANGDEVPESAETLAEILGRAGYRTAAFISLGVLGRRFHLDQGFSFYHDPFDESSTRWYRTADEVMAPVESWVKENGESPFFLWVHFSDPHEPYLSVDSPPDSELTLDGEPVGRYRLVSAEKYREVLSLSPGEHRLRFTSLRKPRPDDRPETAITVTFHRSEKPAAVEVEERLEGNEPIPLTPSFETRLVNRGAVADELPLVFSGGLERPTPEDVLPSYEREVAYTDRFLGELDSLLRPLGEGTLLVVVSDHGEGLFHHDLLGHAKDVYEDQLRIVWLLRGPGIPPGRVIDRPPALITDVAPTILDLLGLEHDGMKGRSWRSCFEGRACPSDDPFWAYSVDHGTRRPEAMAGYRWPYKWMWQRSAGRTGYDVSADPWEESNLLATGGPDHPDSLKSLAESFAAERRELSQALSRRDRPASSEETEELLRSLGYLGSPDRKK
jgi:arylsulfatase A-like enzyme